MVVGCLNGFPHMPNKWQNWGVDLLMPNPILLSILLQLTLTRQQLKGCLNLVPDLTISAPVPGNILP